MRSASLFCSCFTFLAALSALFACAGESGSPSEGLAPGVEADPALANTIQGLWVSDCQAGVDEGVGSLLDRPARRYGSHKRMLAVADDRMIEMSGFFSDGYCRKRILRVETRSRFKIPENGTFGSRSILVRHEKAWIQPYREFVTRLRGREMCGRGDWKAGERYPLTAPECVETFRPHLGKTYEYRFNAVDGVLYIEGETYFRPR